MATKKTEQSFAESFAGLEKITESLEKGVDLDKGIAEFERGLELAAQLKDRLAKAENKIEVIKKKYQAEDELTEE